MNDKADQENTKNQENELAQVGEEEVLENKLSESEEDEACELSEIREELGDLSEEDAAEEDATEEAEEAGSDSSPSSLDKLVMEDLPAKISDYCYNIFKLKKINLTIDKERYLLDFSSKGLEVKKESATVDAPKSNLDVKLASDTFYKIVKKKLNPQIALVNCQVKIEGEDSLAVYFFNLFARAR